MCGITGITDKKLASKENIEKMTSCIAHRGPDDSGFFVDDSVALGMRRLSIIDISRGKQPISSADERYQIFFNGEIYNYKELKKELTTYNFTTDSDTEVILAGFIKWGSDVVRRLRGMFVFAIYDTQEKKVFVARDFFGIKPLYYLQERPVGSTGLSCVVAFSSEIKSFLELPGFKPEVNDAAVYNYLSYQYNPLEETFFKNVWKLLPGHHMTIDLNTTAGAGQAGRAEIKRYWQFEFKQDKTLDEGKTEKNILKTMEDSVEHHMIADVPVGSFLSGGIDSSIIATLMQKVRKENPSTSSGQVKTFTVGFESLSEGLEAKETAEPLGTEHKEITVGAKEYFEALPKAVWHFDEPVADPSALGIYFLSREAAKEVKVVLSGEGSDELFGGYNIYLEPFARKWIAWIPKLVLKFLVSLPFRGRNYAERALSKLEDWYIGNASIFKPKEVREIWQGEKQDKFSLDSLYALVYGQNDSVRMQYIDINTWLVGDILAKADKMTMAHSLELRVPFLDIEVAKLAETLPDKFKWRNGETKYLLREAFKTLLPESTRKRKKLGFPTPVRAWFTKERDDIRKTIIENSYIKEHLSTSVIDKLWENHVSGREDNSRKIYLLLMLAIWYDTFIGK